MSRLKAVFLDGWLIATIFLFLADEWFQWRHRRMIERMWPHG